MKRIKLYVPGESWLHRIHPAVKLVLYGLVTVMVYLLPWQARWLVALVLFGLLWSCGVPPKKYKVMLILSGTATLTSPLLNGLWPTEGDRQVALLFGQVGVYEQGLERGLTFAGLYLCLAMCTFVWVTTTKLWEVAESPTALGLPHVAGFGLAYILRYIPEVAERVMWVRNIHRTRGVRFDRGPIYKRFMREATVLVMTMLYEFSLVGQKTCALQSRGFSFSNQPTMYILAPLERKDRSLMVGATIVVAMMAVIKFMA